jgi:hypothetical protein
VPQFPGEVLQVTFYTGMVFPLDNWEPDRTFMAGMFQETEVIVRGGIGGQLPLPPVNAPLASTANAAAATAGSGPPWVQATTVRGPWYAILRFLDM